MPSEDLAYVIGVEAGDGYVWKRSIPPPRYDEFFVGLMVKDRDFGEFFAIVLAKVLKREPPILRLKDGRWVVEVASKTLYELLKKPIDIERIRPYIEYCERCIATFLRGFFDSEGCVREDGVIDVINTDYQLLVYVIYLLGKIGIETTQRERRINKRAGRLFRDPRTGKLYKSRKNVYYIEIRLRSNLKFYKVVGFTMKLERRRLEGYLRRRGLIPTTSPLHFSTYL